MVCLTVLKKLVNVLTYHYFLVLELVFLYNFD